MRAARREGKKKPRPESSTEGGLFAGLRLILIFGGSRVLGAKTVAGDGGGWGGG